VGWLSLAGALAKALSSVLDLLERRQLMDAGAVRARKADLKLLVWRVDQVQRARRDPAKHKRVLERLRGRE